MRETVAQSIPNAKAIIATTPKEIALGYEKIVKQIMEPQRMQEAVA